MKHRSLRFFVATVLTAQLISANLGPVWPRGPRLLLESAQNRSIVPFGQLPGSIAVLDRRQEQQCLDTDYGEFVYGDSPGWPKELTVFSSSLS